MLKVLFVIRVAPPSGIDSFCLKQAYGRCRTEREKLSLLSDVLIRRGEGVTSTTRRVGPELSKRLFLLMTSTDPQQVLDSTGA